MNAVYTTACKNILRLVCVVLCEIVCVFLMAFAVPVLELHGDEDVSPVVAASRVAIFGLFCSGTNSMTEHAKVCLHDRQKCLTNKAGSEIDPGSVLWKHTAATEPVVLSHATDVFGIFMVRHPVFWLNSLAKESWYDMFPLTKRKRPYLSTEWHKSEVKLTPGDHVDNPTE